MPSTTSSSSNKAILGAQRWQWLNRVHDNPGMTGDACKVMYQIAAKCLDFKSEHPFTTRWGDVAIARLANVHVNTVRNSLTKAERLGLISTIPARGRTPRTITLIVKDLSHNVCESNDDLSHNLTHKMTHKGNSGSLAESTGCAPISYISHISHKYKKEEDGNPRGATPPEKTRYIPFDSPHWETIDRWERNLPPTRRPLRDRRGGCWLTADQWRATMNGGGQTIAVSS
jgi:hypothetical protein